MSFSSRSPSINPIRRVRSRRVLPIASVLLLFLSSAVLLTCGKDGPTSPTPAPEPPRPAKIAITPSTPAPLTSAGQTLRLTATVTDQHGNTLSGTGVTWKSSNTAVAAVNSAGTVTAVRTGSATITVATGNVTAAVQVQVALPFASIIVAPAEPEVLTPGQTLRLEAVAKGQDGVVYRSFTQGLGLTISWTSSDPSVATVSAKGEVTAVGAGSAVITAAAVNTGSARFTAAPGTVRVRVAFPGSPLFGSITVTPPSVTFHAALEEVQLAATVYDAAGALLPGAGVTWSSSDREVADVDGSGRLTSHFVDGTAVITARSGKALGTMTARVTRKVHSLHFGLPRVMSVGDTLRLSAEGRDPRGGRMSVPASAFSWSSGNPAVAAVDEAGLLTVRSDGNATITVSTVSGDGHALKASKTTEVRTPDRTVLIALYHATGGPNWTDRSGWLGDGPVSAWHGVSTDAAGRVTRLDLERNGLKGKILPELGGLSRLAELDLGHNALSGPLPVALSRLGGLRVLRTDGTGLCAPLNASFQAWLAGIPDRRVAGCENRDREALAALYHATNGPGWRQRAGWLSAAPPGEWHGVTVDESGWVRRLDLSDNDLRGALPAALGGLANLTSLDVRFNALSGPVPVALSRLGLETLRVDGTGLCAPQDAAFQAWLDGVADGPVDGCEDREALVALYHATNGPEWRRRAGWLSDAPPGEWHGVTTDENGRVTGLNLHHNRLAGPIPPELGGLASLRHLDLGANVLTGPIPAELAALRRLETLILYNSALTGPIPVELAALRRLETLNLHGNHLTGPIPPELGGLASLRRLFLHDNGLTGPIPAELADLLRLETLNLGGNGLTGGIPAELADLASLQHLRLEDNGLTGPIPPELGGMEQLQLLYLSNNPLSGPIPLALSRLGLPFRLRLDGTRTCVLPDAGFQAWLRGLNDGRLPGPCESPDREALVAFYNATNGPGWTNAAGWLSDAPLSEWRGVSVDGDGRVTELALEGNGLADEIPAELFLLDGLRVLDLGGNDLSGPAPASLGDLESLRVLDLGGNDLSGPAPASLGGLENLRVLDLGGNDLRGRVPPAWSRLGRLEVLRLDRTGLCVLPDAGLQAWLLGIPDGRAATCPDPDREALVAFYDGMNGPGWERENRAGWLSDAPLDQWRGVTTDGNGRVIRLEIEDEGLTGRLPPELGRLDQLRWLYLEGDTQFNDAQLSGGIPPELGRLVNLVELDLIRLGLGGTISPELGNLERLERLRLVRLRLVGGIPPELGNLGNLRALIIARDDLSGGIPPELGRLERLETLSLIGNDLSGPVPAELGRLANLKRLYLYDNRLVGGIPPELASPPDLEEIRLSINNLTGAIPPGLGRLSRLTHLDLGNNRLTGPIPPELARAPLLQFLHLADNDLSGPIPAELGHRETFQVLDLSRNDLSGAVPAELGNLDSLLELSLNGNTALSGPLPPALARLTRLEVLDVSDTGLCAPPDAAFQAWLRGIPNRRVVPCAPAAGVETRTYLTQAVQSLDYPVPLVAGRRALLRVFITADEQAGADMPPARAAFYHDGVPVHAAEAPGRATPVPAEIDEGSLPASINADVPGWVIAPGLEMVIEVDPGGDPASGLRTRLPETGRMAVQVVDVPPFNLTVVPFLWVEDPDRSVLAATEGLTADDDLFRLTQDLLPVGEFSLRVRDYVWSSVEPVYEHTTTMLRETALVRAADGSDGYYMGVLKTGGAGGDRGRKTFLSRLDGETIAHELGHNLGLMHAPCGNLSYDPYYPHADGSIGSWGYDFRTGRLVPPESKDLMSYCSSLANTWISGYHFSKALRYRQAHPTGVAARPAARTLLLWGGVDEFGDPVLEPAFAADAAPSAPPSAGAYRLTGADAAGRVLFSFAFDMGGIADGEGGAFAFALPARPSWAARLSRITLSGPGGAVATGRAGERAAALLRDGAGGVRGVLRDVPVPAAGVAARRMAPEPGLEIVISRGVPDPASW